MKSAKEDDTLQLRGVVAGIVCYCSRDNQRVFYEQVYAIVAVQAYGFVLHRLGMLL